MHELFGHTWFAVQEFIVQTQEGTVRSVFRRRIGTCTRVPHLPIDTRAPVTPIGIVTVCYVIFLYGLFTILYYTLLFFL